MNRKSAFGIIAIIVLLCNAHAEEAWPGEHNDLWHGFKRHNFSVDGCPAWVVEPKQSAVGNQ
jgi:hypothetical protein